MTVTVVDQWLGDSSFTEHISLKNHQNSSLRFSHTIMLQFQEIVK